MTLSTDVRTCLEALIVDDSKVMREMIIACLRAHEGLAFTQPASGLEALERLSLKSSTCVVLDLNMPDIGGLRGHRVHSRAGQAAQLADPGGHHARRRGIARPRARRRRHPLHDQAVLTRLLLGEVRALLGARPGLAAMSDPFDAADFIAGFIAEAEEHLTSANANLLSLEEAAAEGRPTPRQVRELFRSLHTIKGLAAMVGVEPIVDVAHAMETVLREADRAAGQLAARRGRAVARRGSRHRAAVRRWPRRSRWPRRRQRSSSDARRPAPTREPSRPVPRPPPRCRPSCGAS